MSEDPKTTPPPPPPPAPGEVEAELRELGQSLKSLLKRAWESEERQRLQGEIERGLNDAAQSLSTAANDFAATETGKTLKADVEDLGRRIQSGEVETKVRAEVRDALRVVNAEIKKAGEKLGSK